MSRRPAGEDTSANEGRKKGNSPVAWAFAHASRVQVINVLVRREATTRQIATEAELKIGDVAYHLDVLLAVGCARRIGASSRFALREAFFPERLLALIRSATDKGPTLEAGLGHEISSVAEALVHLLRRGILGLMLMNPERPWSPRALSTELGAKLGDAAFHIQRLLQLKLIEFTELVPAGGSVKHLYRPTQMAVEHATLIQALGDQQAPRD